MPGSCSSNIPNGCAGCGPALTLWVISSSSSLSALGHSAYDGSGKKYMSETISSSSGCKMTSVGFTYYGTIDDLKKFYYYGNSSSKESGAVTNIYNYYIDKYGDIYIWMDINMNGNSSSSSTDTGEVTICYPTGQGRTTSKGSSVAGGTYTRKGSADECSVVLDDKTNCSSSYQSSIAVASTNPNCPQGSDSGNGTDCGFPSFSVNDPNPSATRKSENGSTNSVEGCPSSWLFDKTCTTDCSVNKQANLSTEITPEFLYGKNKSIVQTKLSLLEKNEEQNCDGAKCGDGKKDDCWGYAPGSFYLNGKNTGNSTKLKFKISALKEELQKKYKSVSGKIYFYYEGDDKTPCCNDDFGGTILKQLSYSVSTGSSEFKDDYLAVDCGDVDNGSLSENKYISICVTIDSVSFL